MTGVLKITLILNYQKNDTIYIPIGSDWGGINYQFAYGNITSMKIYNNIMDVTNKLLENGSRLHPETLHLHNINLHNLKVERFKLDYIRV